MSGSLTIDRNGRIISEQYGDITTDVLAALIEMSRPDEPVIVEREQAEIARIAGTEARDLACGRLIARIHPAAYSYWERREGKGFWKDKATVDKFLKDNPACRVDSKSRRAVISVLKALPAPG